MYRKLFLASAVALSLLPDAAQALGLGGIRTQSALNEPFVGQVELLDVNPDEIDSIRVKLASEEEFAKVGVERPYFLTRIDFQPQVGPDGRTQIRVSSAEPVREPYLDFLIEVTWPQGRLVKGYTVLLNPPVTTDRRAPGIASPRIASAPGRGGGFPGESRVARPATLARPPASVDTSQFPLRYGPVAPGTGLWQIARSMAPATGASINQTLMALYRSNPDAFIGGDIDLLKVGASLTIPTASELFALDPRSADQEFRAALQGAPVIATPLTDIATGPGPDDRLAIASVAGEGPAGATEGSRTASAVAGARQPELGTIERDLLLVQEAGESTRQETEELRGRIRELEAQLADIQSLLEISNQRVADLQREEATPFEALGGGAESTESTKTETPEVAEEPQPGQTEPAMPEPAIAMEPEALVEAEPPAPLEETTTASPPEESVAALEPWVPEQGEEATPQGTPAPVEPPPLAPPEPDRRLASAQVEPVIARVSPSLSTAADTDTGDSAGSGSEASPWASLLQPIPALVMGTVVAVFLIALAFFRRQRTLEESLAPDALDRPTVVPPAVATEYPAQAAGAEPLTRTAAAAPQKDLRPYSGFGTLGEETEEVDVVSEADVYLTYGRYREAATVLEEEIEKAPERLDVKYKLAEAYHGAGNTEAMEALMAQMQQAGADRINPDQWQRLEDLLLDLRQSEIEEGMSPPLHDRPELRVVEPSWRQQPPELDLDSESEAAVEAESGLSLAKSESPFSGLDIETPAKDDLELELESLETLRSGDSTVSEGLLEPLAPTSDLDLELEDLDTLREAEFEGSSSTVSPAVPLSEDFFSKVPHDSRLGAGGDEGLRGETGEATGEETRDSIGSEVVSSQWQAETAVWDEVATKMDLARAYLEMEDPEAARGILEEVTQEGNESQRAEAREMLARLR